MGQRVRSLLVSTCLLAGPASAAVAQAGVDVLRERADYTVWLRSAPNSPLAAIAQQPIGDGLTLGPAGSDVPLESLPMHRVTGRGGVAALEGPDGRRMLPRGRAVSLGAYSLQLGGTAQRAVLTVFGRDTAAATAPIFYQYDGARVFEGRLAPPGRPGTQRVLALDGIEVEATEAGTVAVPIDGVTHRLRVLRLPVPGTEESELEIFFRDGTSGDGTYPAGRFVPLVPLGDGRYRLDFNRARNPFCAYSTAYPCPLPWRGNTLPVRIEAGERYAGGGADAPSAPGTDR